MVSSGEFYSSVLIPPIQNNQKKPVHALAVRSAVSVHQKRGCFSAGTVYSSALFLMVPEQSEETNQPQRGRYGGAGTVYSAVPFCGVQNNQNKRVAGLFHFAM